jgi:beta-N-acetylhexosaminidase
MSKQVVIVDLEGTQLTIEEKEMLRHPCVAGVLLFTRNYQDLSQLKALTQSVTDINSSLVVMADQEGGRIQRFRQDFTSLPSMRYWGNLYQEEPQEALEDLQCTISTMLLELRASGINLSLMPVLDLDHGMSEVISDRSFGASAELVSSVGRALISTMKNNGAPTVAKHFPGHGGIESDSHYEVSVDQRSKQEIWENDLLPFANLVNDYDAIMPAHIIYPLVNNDVVTFSRYWLQTVLREELGFNGVIISDDLTMYAASQKGDYSARGLAALEAGCELLIAANNRQGALDILAVAEKWTADKSNSRVDHFLEKCRQSSVGVMN